MGLLDDVNYGVSKPRRYVQSISGVQRKIASRVDGVTDNRMQSRPWRRRAPGQIDETPKLKYTDLLELLSEAAAKFNDDLARKGSEFHIRALGTGAGFHIQIVRVTDETVIHQTQLLLDTDVDAENIDKLIDEFMREKGLFIEVEK